MVKGQKVLPGVAYLEMARAAVEVAAGSLAKDRRVLKLKNVVWARPVGVDEEPVQIHIGLYPEEGGFVEAGGEIAYEIYSLAENGETEEVVYSQGSATLSGNTENPVLDLKALQVECNLQKLSGTEVYNIYKTMGLDYGPGHRGIETIYIGQGLVTGQTIIAFFRCRY